MIGAREIPLLPLFAAVARHRSFTAAARELGVAKSVVSEGVKALELRCGARLLERSTRHVRLTEAGSVVLASALSVESAVRVAARPLSSRGEAEVWWREVSALGELGSIVARVRAGGDDAPQQARRLVELAPRRALREIMAATRIARAGVLIQLLEILGELPGRAHLSLLRDHLRSPDLEVMTAAAGALAHRGEGGWLTPLLAAIERAARRPASQRDSYSIEAPIELIAIEGGVPGLNGLRRVRPRLDPRSRHTLIDAVARGRRMVGRRGGARSGPR